MCRLHHRQEEVTVGGVKKKAMLFLVLMVYYLITRLWGIYSAMNEYSDYDEGTYLLIARLINHGILPYRDIFAVHPPLYYYLLALWMRIFGDSYVVGRLFSVFLGLLSVLVAYFVGKELKDWKTGLLFSTLVAMDPTLVLMNGMVFHESTVELFTLLSLYYFVKYEKRKDKKDALLSLFWAGVGSTSKFTILPYAVALYVLLLLYLDEKTKRYAQTCVEVLLTRLQVFILASVYLIMSLIVIDAVLLYPSKELRKILIVPGFHKIELVGHIIPAGIFLALWAVITIYVFKISYFPAIVYATKSLLRNIRWTVVYLFAFLLPKIVIEGFLGFLVSPSYLSQTYLAQGSRYSPLAGFFDVIFLYLNHLSGEKPDFLVFYVPIILVLFFASFQSIKSKTLTKPVVSGPLFLVSAVMYLIVFPVIPNTRFLIPMILTLYLAFLESLPEIEKEDLNIRKFAAVLVFALLILSIGDYGISYQYKEGKLLLAWASHTKDLRDDLGEYIREENLTGIYLAMNPFNAYYLNLKVDPHYLDTFGLVYLKDPSEFQRVINESDYLILSTWMYAMMKESEVFNKTFGGLKKYSVVNATLLYAESYASGDVIELFDNGKKNHSKVGFSSFLGKMQLWINGTNVAYVYVTADGKNLSERTVIRHERSGYTVHQFSGKEVHEFKLFPVDDGILIRFNRPENVTFEFNLPSLVLSGGAKKARTGESGVFRVLTQGSVFILRTDGFVTRNSLKKLMLSNCTFITVYVPEN